MKTLVLFLGMLIFISNIDTYAITFKENLLFTAKLNGSNVTPSVLTNANGIASLVLSKNRDSITVNISLMDLSGAPISVGLYNGLEGVNGNLLVNFNANISGNKITARITGLNVVSNISKLFRESIYILVTTAANPNGEIRGQVKLESDWHFTADLNGNKSVPSVSGIAFGLGSFSMSSNKNAMSYKIICRELTGAITSAKLHYGKAGVVGNLVSDITTSVSGNIITGVLTPSNAMIDSILQGALYINITTAANPSGELRSQLVHHKGLSFEAKSTGAQLVPALSTTAQALSVYRLSPGLDTLYYDIVASGLSSSIDYAHFHVGNAGLPYGALQTDFTNSILGNRIKGIKTGVAVSNLTKNKMLISNLSLIIHTALYPNGELRGQVIRYAREGYTIDMSGNQMIPSVVSNAYGSGIVSIGRNEENAHYLWLAGNLSSPAVSAKFNKNKIGQNGNTIYDMTNVKTVIGNNVMADGYWNNTDSVPFLTSNAIQFSKDSIYLEITNANNPSGEIRGQVLVGHVPYIVINQLVNTNQEFATINTSPNPVIDILNLTLSNLNKSASTISISNISGHSIYELEIDERKAGNKIEINLSNLSKGIYIVKVVNDNYNYVKKIIKE